MSEKREWTENEKWLFGGVAWAQCIKVNPTNPLSVAQNIGKMVKALKLYQEHQEGTSGHYCWQCAEAINKVLSAIKEG